jgi:2-oxoglutarate/2-oxoacid ferredoxin oxidoreductase subunit alpha
MSIDITVKIGGEAGQGIQTAGQLLMLVCQRAGLYAMGINDFESRIRGGHSFFQMRICNKPVYAPHHLVHLLVAMDNKTYELHRDEVLHDGTVILNRGSTPESGNVLPVPIHELSKKAGGLITANTVAAGIILALIGTPLDIFEKVILKQFSVKGDKVLSQNMAAAKLGYSVGEKHSFKYSFLWPKIKKTGILVDGAQSFALGALAGDCRFASFYPMSPATSIMVNLAAWQDRFPLVVEQAEDEISAVNMIIGASFAGVRSITATSGGGFCLMTEGLGYAGIAEIPIVIINSQRPGPATGLPTRTGQGDLQFVIRAAQDDFPLFVFAPGSPQEAFAVTARALTLAEKYQAPAVILGDQFLNDSVYILPDKFVVPEKVESFTDNKKSLTYDKKYKRYVLTKSGISPRLLPCMGKTLVMASGNEHSEDGHITETSTDRTNMMDKRARKQQSMLSEIRPPSEYHAYEKIVLVGWGSTWGIIREAADMLRVDGIMTGAVHFCDLWPFPSKSAFQLLSKADSLFIVECNSTAQFAQLLTQETGLTPAGTILKYDGRPFYPAEVYNTVKQTVG